MRTFNAGAFTLTRKKSLATAIIAGLVAAVALVAGVAAFASGDGDTPVSDEPNGGAVDATGSLLHQARLDLAERLDVDALDDVHIRNLQPAGWDGCLGIDDGSACTEQFIAGAIAMFEAEGEQYRYHLGDGRFIATDFVEGEVRDGLEIPDDMPVDLNAMVARYAKGDLALRNDVEPAEITTTVLAPVTFADGCLGFEEEPATGCDDAIYQGAIVLLEHDGEEARYHVSDSGRVVPVSFTAGQPTIDVNENVREVQRDMREDVAANVGTDSSEVSIDSFRIVTWPDGCLGVYTDDAGCTEALVEDGFIAMLEADGKLYRYHGSPDTFIGVDFLDREVRLGEPLSPEKDPRDSSGDSEEQDSGAYVPEGNDAALPQALVKELAATLEVDASDIEVRSFEEVTWPDGCLGVYYEDTVCTQALVPGYIAELQYLDEVYRYFGSGADFANVTLLDSDEVRLGEPVDD